MTYRNDHDAALARVDALEQENARLARENEQLRATRKTSPYVFAPPPRHRDADPLVVRLVAAFACVVLAMLTRMCV